MSELGDYDSWKAREPDVDLDDVTDECIADDSTECDCSSCEEELAAWESDQGWDDDDGYDDDYEDPDDVERWTCIDPKNCVNPHFYHQRSECQFAPLYVKPLTGRQRTRRLWAKRGRR